MTPHAINKGWGVRLALLWGKAEDCVHCDRGGKKKKPLRLFKQRRPTWKSISVAAPLTWRPATVSLWFRCTFLKPKAPACVKYSRTSPVIKHFHFHFSLSLGADVNSRHFTLCSSSEKPGGAAQSKLLDCRSTCLSLSLIRTKRGPGDRPADRRIWSWKITFRRHCSIFDGGYTFIGKLKKKTINK